MLFYNNVFKLENYFRKNYNLISYAFSSGMRHYKDESQWWYPQMMTFSGSKVKYGDITLDLIRNYKNNGAAHILVGSHYVRLSSCYCIKPTASCSESYIFFHAKDLQSRKFDALHYWFFVNEKYNRAVKVDWQKIKDKLNPVEAMSDYLCVNLNTISEYVTEYFIENVPPDYLHPFNFESQKRLFSEKIAGSNKRKVHLIKTNGSVCEFESLKQFYEELSHFRNAKFTVKNYNSLKSMLSQNKPLGRVHTKEKRQNNR